MAFQETDNIKSMFDLASLGVEKEKVLANLLEVEAMADRLKNIKIKLQSSDTGAGITATINEASTAISRYTQVSGNAAAQNTRLAESIKSTASAYTTQAGAVQGLVNSLEENIQVLLRNRNALDVNKEAQKDFKKQLEAGIITRDQYNEKISAAIKKEFEYKQAISEVNKEIKNSVRADFAEPNSITAARSQNITLRQVRDATDASDVGRLQEINDLIDRNNDLIDQNSDKLSRQKINIGNYPNLFQQAFGTLHTELKRVENDLSSGAFSGKELENLTLKQKVLKDATSLVGQEFTSAAAQSKAYENAAKNIGQVYGGNSQVFKTFAKDVIAGNIQLKEINNTVKGVGSEASRATSSLSKMWTGLKTIANILPGIGIAGLIGFAAGPIIDFTTNMFGATEAEKKAAEATKKHKQEIDDLIDSYRNLGSHQDSAFGSTAAEITKVEGLAKVVLDQTNSYKERNNALLELQRINKNYFGDLTLEESSLRVLSKAVDEYTNALIQQAVIKEVEQDIGKLGAAYFRQLRNVRAAETALRDYKDSTIKANEADIKRGVVIFDATNKAADLGESLFNEQKALKPLADQYSALTGELRDLNLESLKFKPLHADTKRDETDPVKASLELLKYQKEQEAKLQKEISEIEFLSSEKRIEARKRESELEIQVLEIQGQIEIRKKNITADEITKVHAKQSDEIAKNEADLAVAIIGIRAKSAEAQKKSDEDINNEFKRQSAEREAAEREEAKRQLDNSADRLNKRVNFLSIDRDSELKALESQRSQGLISEKAYQAKRLAIEQDYDKYILLAQLDHVNEMIALRKLAGEDVTKLEADAKALELKIIRGQNKLILDEDKKLGEERKKLREDLSKDILNLGAELVKDSFETQKNELQNQIDLLEQRKQKEIEVANATITNEQDRAAAITTITARAAAQREQLELRQRRIDQERARFEKAVALISIAIDTVKKVFQIQAEAAVLASNPATLALAPAALAQIPFIIASGAIAATLIAAKPIPKYKDGTKDHPGGLAEVGDAGKKEVIMTREGKFYSTPSVPTVLDIPKHAMVFPDVDASFKYAIANQKLPAMINSGDDKWLSEQIGKNLKKHLGRVVQAIEDKPVSRTTITGQGLREIFSNGQRQWEWINRNMQS